MTVVQGVFKPLNPPPPPRVHTTACSEDFHVMATNAVRTLTDVHVLWFWIGIMSGPVRVLLSFASLQTSTDQSFQSIGKEQFLIGLFEVSVPL